MIFEALSRKLYAEKKEEEQRILKKLQDDFIALLFESKLADEISFAEAMAKIAADPRYVKITDIVRLYTSSSFLSHSVKKNDCFLSTQRPSLKWSAKKKMRV